jgi:poly(glycerol-phosphate) alpha-glucosyltransferase
MKASILTGSVSRQAGGTFDAIRRPGSIMACQHNASIQILGTVDADTESDRSGWHPLSPETFEVKGPRSFGYAGGMGAALERFQPDLQHVHGLWMYCSFVNYRYHSQKRTPYVISPHGMLDSWAVRNSAWKKRLAGWAFERKHLAQANCLHALCAPELAAFRDFGLNNPVCVISNGIDLPQRQGHPAPWIEQVAAGQKVLLYLGRLHPKKGLINLLRAWRQVLVDNKRHSGWVLALAGPDQMGHEIELQKLSKNLGLDQSVLFLGPRFGMAKQACYENADAFILPSFSEGLPMTVLEAWAYGLPVLMTPQCNIPEGFARNAAIKVEPNDEGIATGLRHLFTLTDAERKDMGRHGLSLVKQKFTWEKVAGEMHKVYQWILGGGTPPENMRFI